MVRFAVELAEALDGVCSSPEFLQYADYAQWRSDLLVSSAAAEAQRFWETRTGSPPLFRCITSPGTAATGGKSIVLPIDAAAVRATMSLAYARQWSVGRVSRVAWHTLLAQLSCGTRVPLQNVVSGRGYPELDAAFGPLEIFLPEAAIDLDWTVNEAVARLQEADSDAEEWQDYYPGLSDESGWVAFEEHDIRGEWVGGGVRVSIESVERIGERFALRLCAVRSNAGWGLELHDNSGRWDTGSLSWMAERLAVLLGGIAGRPDARLRDLPLLGARERAWLAGHNDTMRALSNADLVHQRIERQARLQPDVVAVECGSEQVSFSELNRRANRLACWLIRRGMAAERCVAVEMAAGIASIVALVAIGKTGAAYLILDPALPAARREVQLRDSGAGLTLSHALLAGIAEELAGESCEDIGVAVPDQALAYILYTSGTTGEPCGVAVSHGSVRNLADALEERIYAGSGIRRVSLTAGLGFDASVKQWIQLGQGRTLMVVPEATRRDVDAWLGYLEARGIEAADATPSRLAAALERGAASRVPHWLVGGEAVGGQLWDQLAACGGHWNLYGPTECTVDATAACIEGNAPSLGRALANVEVWIVDAQGDLAAAGVEGELWIGGAGLARGYLHDAARTADRFVPDPFSGRSGSRLYRTGDIGRYGSDGRIEYLGRRDGQVKARGYRVELGEIEAALERHPGVRRAASALRDGQPQAWVVSRWGGLGQRGRRLGSAGPEIEEQNRYETEVLWEEIWSRQVYGRHGIRLEAGSCVWDVGANIGLFTLWVAGQVPGARIYAFEPMAEVYQKLERNCGRNRVSCQLERVALGEKEGWEDFWYFGGCTALSGRQDRVELAAEREWVQRWVEPGVWGQWRHELEQIVERRLAGELRSCRMERLSRVLARSQEARIDLLKIDVQGSEWEVLSGIDEEDWDRIGQIVVEVHDRAGALSAGRLERVRELLAGHGYGVWAEQCEALEGSDRWMVYARREGLRPAASVGASRCRASRRWSGPKRGCAAGWPSGCRITCCLRALSRSIVCRCRPTASSTAMACRRRRRPRRLWSARC